MWGGCLGPAEAGVRGDRRGVCPACLGPASGLEAEEPAVEGEGVRGRGRVRGEAWGELGGPEGSVDEGAGKMWSRQSSWRGCSLRECGMRLVYRKQKLISRVHDCLEVAKSYSLAFNAALLMC